MKNFSQTQPTILGLDLGAQSLGWILLSADEKGEPTGIIDAGSRVFEAGINIQLSGEKASKNLERRSARGRRRLLDRTSRRLTKLLHALQRGNLLPEGDLHGHLAKGQSPLADLFLNDTELDPYQLRTHGLTEKLDLHAFGRALYHLAQRRGFLSNAKLGEEEIEKEEDKKKSKKAEKDSDDLGVVKRETAALEKEWREEKGFPTWGAFLASLDPHERRRRGLRTLRRWYREEFDALWEAQKKHHPQALSDELYRDIADCIFFQRPLQSPHRYIGPCLLESKPLWVERKKAGHTVKARIQAGPKRAPMADLLAQEARFLQTVNDLRIIDKTTRLESDLTPEQRELLIKELDLHRKMTFPAIRTLLKLKKVEFNFEKGKRKDIPGNRTSADMRRVFGERWDAFSREEKDQAIEDARTIHDMAALKKRGIKHWKLDEAQATAFSRFAPEQGYHSLSRQALRKVLPALRAGQNLHDAIEAAYPNREQDAPVDLLPPADDVRSPIVQRAIAELRKVVNAIIREHGKPGKIRLELARDLKKTQKQRDEIASNNRKREKQRDTARKAIIQEIGHQHVTNHQVQKFLLWEECGGICPYTGNAISMSNLFGEAPEFDIEHIIPFSRSLDNSFLNKTLCHVDYNRKVKGNKTPWETVGRAADQGDPEAIQKWNDILDRVRRFRGDQGACQAKMLRFRMKDIPEDTGEVLEGFSNRALNDTQYASRLAREYLSQLYGGKRQFVQVAGGQVTAYLRRAWQLSSILDGDGEKTRNDHRHHVIDAFCLACSTPAMVKNLHSAAARGVSLYKPGAFLEMAEPWPSFDRQLRQIIGDLIVSHRVSRKVSGALHKESHYGKITVPDPKKKQKATERTVLRKPLSALSVKNLENIVDGEVRRVVQAHVKNLKAETGQDDKKVMALLGEEANLPGLPGPDGRIIPIRKVRIFVDDKPRKIGQGDRERLINPGNNHHLAVYETKDKKGNPTWKTEVVSLLDAAERKKNNQPIVARKDADGNPLLFSLVIGDTVEIDWEGERILCCVQSISPNDYELRRLNDARLARDIKATGERIRIKSVTRLYAIKMRKKQVFPLGKVRNAHD